MGVAIEQMLYLLDQAFEGDDEHSLLANLRSLRDDDWRSPAPGGGRTVLHLVQHVGQCKYTYENHAFGDGSMLGRVAGSFPRPWR
jgi:hypothetical protein